MIDLTVANGTVRAGIACLSNTPEFAAEHGSQPDLCLIWNDFAADAAAIDIVLYFHGFALGRDGTPPLSTFVDVSGLFDGRTGVTFARRERPTLVVIPRGDGQPLTKGAWPYRFPATIARPDQVIGLALREIAAARRLRAPEAPEALTAERLLLMAHSGGGLAVLEVLAKLATPPSEIYLFDALYQQPDALTHWVAGTLDRGDRTARLWVGYAGTKQFSECLADKLVTVLAGQPADVAARFRVEPVAVKHMEIPRTYAPGLLLGDGAARRVA